MPTYEHKCENCEHEWEDIYKMSDPIPEECPECKTKGKVKRLISLCSGTVELTGQELVNKLRTDARKEMRNMKENDQANIVGEDKYHAAETRKDKIKKDFGKHA